MKLDLALAASLRTPKTLPAIETTKTQADQLYRVYIQPVVMWNRAWQDQIRPEYERTLAQIVTDSVFDLEMILGAVNSVIARLTASIWTSEISVWIDNIDRWHLRRMISNLKYATNVDLTGILRAGGQPETLAAVLQRNVNLVRSVSDQTRERIADIVFRGLTQRTPVRDVARDVAKATGISRARARRIAIDQTVKLSAALDRERMAEVGITEFEWKHSGKIHFRKWHKDRDGKTFKFNDPQLRGDLPGDQPFCGCKARGIIT